MNCSYNSRTTRWGVTFTRSTAWLAAFSIALPTDSYIARCSGVHVVAAIEASRARHWVDFSAATYPSAMRFQAAQVGSSVIMPTGPFDLLFEKSDPQPPPGIAFVHFPGPFLSTTTLST